MRQLRVGATLSYHTKISKITYATTPFKIFLLNVGIFQNTLTDGKVFTETYVRSLTPTLWCASPDTCVPTSNRNSCCSGS